MGVSDVEGYKVESSTPRGKSHGQSLVEFAVMSLVLVLILAITVDFARAFSAYISIGNVARAGAQAGTISEVLGAEDNGQVEILIQDAADAEESSIYGNPVSVISRLCTDAAGYELVQVRVEYDFEPILAIGPILGTYRLERYVEMRAQMMGPGVDFDTPCI